MGKLGLLAVCGVLLVAALFLMVRRESGHAGRVFTAAERETTAPLAESDAVVAPAPSSTTDARPIPTRVARAEAQPRGTLHGRLVAAENGAPLRAEKVLLLSSPLNTIAETLRTGADGSFTSARRFPRGLVRAWVSEPETRALLVRHEAEFDPESPDEWLVPVPRHEVPAALFEVEEGEVVLRGSVVDLERRAVAGVQVKLFSLGTLGPVNSGSATDASGEFRLEELVPGPHRLLVQGRFTSSAPHELELVPGLNDAGVILLPATAGAGALRGRLVVDAGGEDPFGIVLLRELASGKELAVTTDWSLFSDEDDGATSFLIEDVPAGEYELCVVSVDGRQYEPASMRVSPPAEGLEFRARGTPPRRFGLRVRDARTGDELLRFVTLGRIRGQWYGGDLGPESQLPDGFDRWIVYAEGYRPARGDFSQARLAALEDVPGDEDQEGELRQVEVALQPGHALAVLCKDVESDRLVAPEFEDLFGPGLAGVTVLADGEPVAQSDRDGLALVDLPRAPERLEFRRAGWRVVGERESEGLLLVHLARD